MNLCIETMSMFAIHPCTGKEEKIQNIDFLGDEIVFKDGDIFPFHDILAARVNGLICPAKYCMCKIHENMKAMEKHERKL